MEQILSSLLAEERNTQLLQVCLSPNHLHGESPFVMSVTEDKPNTSWVNTTPIPPAAGKQMQGGPGESTQEFSNTSDLFSMRSFERPLQSERSTALGRRKY